MTEATKKALQLGIITSLFMATAMTGSAQTADAPAPVDLGLSVFWGDRHLGAESPQEPGYFFAFGETAPKENYGWSTYLHCEDGDMFSQTDFGTESIAGTEYDAAHVMLGGKWRMPTAEECQELIDNTAWTVRGTEGEQQSMVFTASNGNSISFPITGYMSLDKNVYGHLDGPCWTATVYSECGEEDGFAYRLNSPYFLVISVRKEADTPYVDDAACQMGFPIRPVMAIETSVDPVGIDGTSTVADIHSIDGTPAAPDPALLAPGIYIVRYSDGRTEKIIR